MNYLLDTHTLIWFLDGDDSLSVRARDKIQSAQDQKFVSIASLWEISIKVSLGKLILKSSLEDFFYSLSNTEIRILDISPAHLLKVSQIEFFHKDPFDRLIIAQSIQEHWDIIGKDPSFPQYGINLYW